VTLYLIRHGVADGADGRCVGHCDVALSADGRSALEGLARGWPTPRPPRVVASDLARARDSAAALADAWGMTVHADPRLREMDFGRWDGRTWVEIERDQPDALARWMAEWQDARAPGGEGFGDVVARAGAWLDDAVAQARAEGIDRVAVLAHAGSIRALLVHAVGLSRALAFRLRLDHARVSALRVAADPPRGAWGSAEVLFLNADRVPVG
jgi:broad specificity phosphatase PhoE